jgi:tetratricopeptide (TPR) repeat protein
MLVSLLLVGVLGAQPVLDPPDLPHVQPQTDAQVELQQKAVQKAPADPRARLELAMAYANAEEYEMAMSELIEAIRLNPENKDNLSGHANFHLGLVLSVLDRPSLAIKAYREALRLGLKHASVHTALGGALTAEGKFPEAIDEYQEALALEPDSFGAHSGLGLALEASGRLDEALLQYEAALRAAPLEDDHAVDAIRERLATLKERRQL